MDKQIIYISPMEVVPNLYQPRKHFDEDAIDELAQSIKNYGIIQPISVRKIGGSYELVAGERRLRASKKLGLEQIPAILVDITEMESASIALLENLQRENLNFIEEAEAYHNLIKDHGYTQEKLAESIGKKQSTISNKLRLLKLSSEVREKLILNNLTERHARALLKVELPEHQLRIINIIIERGLNVKATEMLIERELMKIAEEEAAATNTKKRIKGIFNTKIYINTIKQVFEKYGLVDAGYSSKETDEYVELIVKIPKNK